MSTANGGIFIKGKSNGTTTYKDKNGKYWYQVIMIIPDSEQNLRVGLHESSDPAKFAHGMDVTLEVTPRFFNGKFQGFQELKRAA